MTGRRANGEGTISRRQDGRWTARAYVLRPDGGRVRRQVYGRTRAEVSAKLADMQVATSKGVPLAVEAWTFDGFADHWLEHVATAELRPSTVSSYRALLRLHVRPALGSKRLRGISVAQVRALIRAKSDEGLSARTVQMIHATIRTVLSSAARDELVERIVALLVRPPRVARIEVRPWSPSEASQFLSSCRGHRLYALFSVGVALGLRRGELLGLRWEDLDLDARLLHVRETVQRVQGAGLIVGPPKSARSRRSVPVPDMCVRTLREHRLVQVEERLLAGEGWIDSGRVFTSSAGTILEPRNLSRLFEERMASAGVRRIRFHDLRHTCASLLLAQGVQPRVVMEVLGHSQLAMTMDLYSHVMPTALREAAEAMDQALGDR